METEFSILFQYYCQNEYGAHILELTKAFPRRLSDHDFGTPNYFEALKQEIDATETHQNACLTCSAPTCHVCYEEPSSQILLVKRCLLASKAPLVKVISAAVCQSLECCKIASDTLSSASELLDRQLTYFERASWPEVVFPKRKKTSPGCTVNAKIDHSVDILEHSIKSDESIRNVSTLMPNNQDQVQIYRKSPKHSCLMHMGSHATPDGNATSTTTAHELLSSVLVAEPNETTPKPQSDLMIPETPRRKPTIQMVSVPVSAPAVEILARLHSNDSELTITQAAGLNLHQTQEESVRMSHVLQGTPTNSACSHSSLNSTPTQRVQVPVYTPPLLARFRNNISSTRVDQAQQQQQQLHATNVLLEQPNSPPRIAPFSPPTPTSSSLEPLAATPSKNGGSMRHGRSSTTTPTAVLQASSTPMSRSEPKLMNLLQALRSIRPATHRGLLCSSHAKSIDLMTATRSNPPDSTSLSSSPRPAQNQVACHKTIKSTDCMHRGLCASFIGGARQ